MTTVVREFLPINYDPSRLQTPKSKVIGEFQTPTMSSVMKHAHDNTLISLAHNFATRHSKRDENYRKFSESLLKNKSLLVPTRLALRRQRAALKSPALHYEPLRSAAYQIELGTSIETTSSSPEYIRTKSTNSHGRGDTPQTIPTDISLMYREKPVFTHPITGNFIVQYAEDHGTPSPCSYVLPRKPYRERNAPAYTFGARCLVEKKGGSRTSWDKQWFSHSNPYTNKVDFSRENAWPTPFHYPARPTMGFQSSKVTFPAYSIGTRPENGSSIVSESNPAPDSYDAGEAFRKLTTKSASITLKSRTGGTQISTNQSTGDAPLIIEKNDDMICLYPIDSTPGPGAHDPSKFLIIKPSSPKHSFGKRIPTSLRQDPYVNALPGLRTSP